MDGLTYMWEAELTGPSDGWMDWVRNKGNRQRLLLFFRHKPMGRWRCDLQKLRAWRRNQQGRGKIKISV